MIDAPELWSAILWLHLLAMAFFVGGQMFILVAVLPVERAAPDRERMRAVARHFGYGSLAAILILLATGSAMASHEHLWSDPVLQLKLALFAAVGILLLAHTWRPTAHWIEALVFLLSLLIVWQGLTLAGGA